MEKINFINTNSETPVLPAILKEDTSPAKSQSSFQDLLSGLLDNTDQQLQKSDQTVQNFLQGKLNNPHELMIKMEEAHLTLQFTLQMRNKVVDAYNEMMRMQL